MPESAVVTDEFNIMRGLRCARNAALMLMACALPAGAQSLDDVLDELLEEEIEAQVEAQIEGQIESQIETQIESTVQDAIERQVESTVAEGIEAGIESAVGIGAEVGNTIGIGVDTGIGVNLSLELDELIATLTAGSRESARFAAGVDPDDRTVEAEVWVVLVPSQYADRIETWGFSLLERRDLDALDSVLLRVEAPEDREIAEAALELALDAPGTVVDFNHVYESTDDEIAGAPTTVAATGSGLAEKLQPSAVPFTIGMIDSIVDPSHSALTGVLIEQQDFVPFGNERTVVHGTAVASVIADAAKDSVGRVALSKLRAASVFFRDDDGQVRATTAGLVAALDWLAGTPDLRVVNMSLAGPPNRLLEAALGDVATRGVIVVAAVGNNGPTGAPLYPAAYDTVVGVTAVDSGHRVYRYANRGRQVMFSALGVQVEVAAPAGGFSIQSGTSLASPRVAALLGETMAAGSLAAAAAIEGLQTTALDLGDRHYDEIYGYGLVRRNR